MRKIEVENLPQVEIPVLSPAARLLWEAADYMERVGWCSGPNRNGRVCAIGALQAVSTPFEEPYMMARESLQQFLDDRGVNESIPAWSDNSDQATVVKALREAALGGQ